MSPLPIELHYDLEKKFSSKLIIYNDKNIPIGYSLIGQYINIKGRRFSFIEGLKIYYTVRDYAEITQFKNNENYAVSEVLYRNEVYKLERWYDNSRMGGHGKAELFKDGSLIAQIICKKQGGLLNPLKNSGNVFLLVNTNTESFGVYLAMLFFAKEKFNPYDPD